MRGECRRGTLTVTPTGQTCAFSAPQVLELLDGPPLESNRPEQKLSAGCEELPPPGAPGLTPSSRPLAAIKRLGPGLPDITGTAEPAPLPDRRIHPDLSRRQGVGRTGLWNWPIGVRGPRAFQPCCLPGRHRGVGQLNFWQVRLHCADVLAGRSAGRLYLMLHASVSQLKRG